MDYAIFSHHSTITQWLTPDLDDQIHSHLHRYTSWISIARNVFVCSEESGCYSCVPIAYNFLESFDVLSMVNTEIMLNCVV